MQVSRGLPATLTIEVRTYDGDLATPTGSVAVVVKDIDAVTVASGNAVVSATAGVYTFTLPSAVTGELGAYTVTASYTLSGVAQSRAYAVEVVGQYLFEIHELRAYDRAIASTTDYTAEEIRKAREAATARLERAAQVAFSPRVKRATLSGDGTARLVVPDVMVRECLSASVWDEELGADTEDGLSPTEIIDVEVDTDAGVLVRTDGQVWPVGFRNIVVDYEHGYETVPAPVKQVAMMLAIETLVPSGLPMRATSQATDIGDFRISLANLDAGRPTGIPEVDAVMGEFGRRRPQVG